MSFFSICYSEVTRARSRAFFVAANGRYRLLIVTISNLIYRKGGRNYGYLLDRPTNIEHRTSAPASRRRPHHGRARSAEVVGMVRRLWASRNGRVLRSARLSTRPCFCRSCLDQRDRQWLPDRARIGRP